MTATDTRRRAVYRLKRLRSNPTPLVGAVFALLLIFLVLAPVASLLLDGFTVQQGDASRIGEEVGGLTSYYWDRVFTSEISQVSFWKPLGRTLAISIGVTSLALGLGGLMGWLVVRTDMPGRKALGTLLIVPYIMPSWTFALAWLTIFKNRRVGGQPGFLESVGFTPPDWLAYGVIPITIALAFHYFPFFLLLVGNGLRRLDSQMEESAQILGASRRTVARRIILPLMLPAVMSAVLLTVSRAIGTFGTPYILGLPVNYTVLSTSVFRSFQVREPGSVALLAGVMILLGVTVVVMDMWMLRNYKRFVTVGGKGAMRRTVNLGRWRRPAALLSVGVVVVTTIAPLAVLFLSTVMVRPGEYSLENFTSQFWMADFISTTPGFPQGLLKSPELLTAAWNSFRVAGIAAVVCGLVGLLAGYVVVRLPGSRIAATVRQLSFLPYLVPGIAFGAAYISLFAVSRGPFPALYGTMTLLVLALIVSNLPYSSRAGISAMMQLGHEPEEAAQIAGAGWFRRLGRILLPLQKGALAAGVILPFITAMKELSLVIILVTPGTELLSTLSIRLVDFGYNQQANAVILVIVIVVIIATYLGQKLTGSDLTAGLES